jgi:minor extracellular serine protease Vpr
MAQDNAARRLARNFPLLLAAIIALGVNATTQSQPATSGKQLIEAPNHGQVIKGSRMSEKHMVTVVVVMVGDPVAVVRQRTPGKRLAVASEQAIAATLRSQQEALVPMLRAHGAKVLARMQYAINGIKITAPSDQLEALRRLPGVIAVKPVLVHNLDNATSVPFIGTPQAWATAPGLHGEGIKIAILDTGIDYTHANFAGPGTVSAFNAAAASSTLPADPTLFGPNAPKVKGGYDLVGDAYNANDPAHNTPVPDSNPLDCNGHGSHVAGTIAGFGELSDGSTYTGSYDTTTPSNVFRIGPGVAPKADLYIGRVFGCVGSTNVVVEAIDWAMQQHVDVISMSLGSNFGPEDSADALAATNAANSGIIVVAASGNAGPVPYITSSPAAGDKTISVAAMDSHQSYPGAAVTLSPSASIINTQNSNASNFTDGTAMQVVVLRNPDNSISLGCNESEYVDSLVSGKLVVALRGVCARINHAIFGQNHGAAAVALINTSAGYPPLEGPISGVTIPFLGVLQADGSALANASGVSIANNSGVVNPTFRGLASFSSGGPRRNDSHLKPDVAAPGVNIISTGMGTGNQAIMESGTSMATPHVAGVAALALQAHHSWSPDDVRISVVNTSDPSQLTGFSPRLAGSGLVQPYNAVRDGVVARGGNDEANLSFGVLEFSQDLSTGADLTVQNNSSQAVNFNVSAQATNGVLHTPSVASSSLGLAAGGNGTVHLNLAVPAATVGNYSAFREAAGLVQLTPTSTDNAGVSLTIPYYLVPRARSLVTSTIGSNFGPYENTSTNAQIANTSSVSGTADLYAWGLSGQNSAAGEVGLRAVGAQSVDTSSGKVLVFAVNTFAPWAYGGVDEFDILIDVNGDGIPDYDLFSYDFGVVSGAGANGQVVTFLENLATRRTISEFVATAPYNGSTILMPVKAADMGITSSNPRISYSAQSFAYNGGSDSISASAKFNAFTNAITTGVPVVAIAAGGNASVPLSINSSEWALSPALGSMIVTLDNYAGAQQAQLLQVTNASPATTTALTSAPNPSAFGQLVTFTASVSSNSGIPTGTVTFKDGVNSLGSTSLDGSGRASFGTAALAVGSHSIVASYGGDGTFTASDSSALSQTVGKTSSTTSVVTNLTPSRFNQSVTFTATVNSLAGTPTGTVTFTDGINTLGSTPVNNAGQAALTISSLAAGGYSVTASYSGDGSFAASSAFVSQTVYPANSTTALISSLSATVYGQSVTFTSTVTAQYGGSATGSIAFYDGGSLLGTVAVAGNSASISTSALTAGSHSIHSIYSGDANVNVSSSGTVAESVSKASTHTVVVGSPNPAVSGANVTFTATITPVAGGNAGGTVTFKLGTNVLATSPVAGNAASFSTSSLPLGTSMIKASYSGDSNLQGSSAATSEVVKAATTTSITSSNSSISYGDTITLQATVGSTAGSPADGEKVTFKNGTRTIGTATLSGGVASLTTSSLPVGNLSLSALYAGETQFLGSSASLSETVSKVSTSVALSSTQAGPGQQVTLTATVSATTGSAVPVGAVTFKEGTKLLGTAKLGGGTASITTSLTPGSHSIVVNYGGNTNFIGSSASSTVAVQ